MTLDGNKMIELVLEDVQAGCEGLKALKTVEARGGVLIVILLVRRFIVVCAGCRNL